MMNYIPLTVIILTYNEELNIRQALENISAWAEAIFVLDSGSTDNTITIAERYGAKVFYRKFDNYASQRNYALRELPFNTAWILFLDADESLTDDLKQEINAVVNKPNNAVNGYYLKRRFYWLGKWLKHGGMYPIWILRLVKHRYATCNPRTVNEHLEVEGKTDYLENDFLHIDLKPISEWIAKHNSYSTFEAQEQLKTKINFEKDSLSYISGSQVERKRWIREKIWNRMLPPLLRPFIYFFYVYIIRLGFLDGKAGFIYHILHAFSYRFMIETKYLALKKNKTESIN